ncbi:MAG: Holliday junction branch migration protein RuvA [Acidimicrobiia bacterium]|nr:Holliday junction branch migration protein RuvA [Acidimicrobiia bacterium]
MIIGSLRGLLVDRTDGEVIVEVVGIGYRLTVSPATAVQLGELGDDVFLHVHHNIREDAQSLFGFLTRDERRTFEALLGAHGVGPALALAILSVHEPVALQAILATDDVAALCLVPGVGKKTAARLLVELKSRLDIPDMDVTGMTAAPNRPAPSATSDVQQALAELGYGADEIRDVLRDLPAEGDSALLLRQALQKLAVRA